MTNFVKGQWAICDGAYVQIEQPAYRRGLMVCRIAGSDRRKCISIKRLTPSSPTPDFSNANVGESCFDVELEHCEISEVRECDVYTMLMVDDGTAEKAHENLMCWVKTNEAMMAIAEGNKPCES